MSEKRNRNIYKIYDNEDNGKVCVTDGVVATIAGLAATETEGVASMAGNITYDLLARMGARNLSKGISVEIENHSVRLELDLNIEYGYNIKDTCEAAQEKVKNSIENMTGLSVREININIAGVKLEEE